MEAGRGTRGAANGGQLDGQIRTAGIIGSIEAVNLTQADPGHFEFAGAIYQINDPNKADLVGTFFGDSSMTIIAGPTRGTSSTSSIVDPNEIPGLAQYFVAGYHSHPANSLFFSGDSRAGTQDFAVPAAGYPLFMGTSTGGNSYRVRVALPTPTGTNFPDKVVFSGNYP